MPSCPMCHEPFTPTGYWTITYGGKVELWLLAKRDGEAILPPCPTCLIGLIERSRDDPLPRDVSGRSKRDMVE